MRRLALVMAGILTFLAAPAVASAAPTYTPLMWAFSVTHTVPAGAATTLSVYVDTALDGTPDFVRIADVTNGLYHNCGTGTSCNWTAGFPSGIHKFVAHLDSGKGGPAPYPVVQSTAPIYIVWSAAPSFSVSLTKTNGIFYATANQAITTTPYFIQLYNADTGIRYATCGTGSTCTTPLNDDTVNVVATIGPYNTTFPQPGVVAVSNTWTRYPGIAG